MLVVLRRRQEGALREGGAVGPEKVEAAGLPPPSLCMRERAKAGRCEAVTRQDLGRAGLGLG